MNLLRSQWLNLLQELSVDPILGEKIFSEMVETYSHPARHYHNLNHIRQVLEVLGTVKSQSHCFTSLQLAAWFHDYVYFPQRQDNEVKSAICGEQILTKLGVDKKLIEITKELIISTRKHQLLTNSYDNSIFLDADLSILGASSKDYQQYAQAIRLEYIHLSDRDYYQGRKRVLSNFLSRNRIYYTDYFYQRLERQARNNLQLEIEQY